VSQPRAYYNEHDEFAAAWLRELIAAGEIAPGDVDTRSIEDVRPDDLKGYTQCHFFAGIGVWSYALRRAGWRDEWPIWTGSCPCQPFSAAGKGQGFADERHLWPTWQWLIGQCNPAIVLGEQVASKDGLAWLDTVCADMEGAGYAIGATDLCAAGVGAPHIRQRLWFVAKGLEHAARDGWCQWRAEPGGRGAAARRESGGLADADEQGSGGRRVQRPGQGDGAGLGASRERFAGFRATSGLDDTASARHIGAVAGPEKDSRNKARLRVSGEGRGLGGLADADRRFSGDGRVQPGGQHGQQPENGRSGELDNRGRPGPTNGLWQNADWLHCRDGKWRPVEPGTFPLAHGSSARVGRLRGYGNAITAEAARIFIEAALTEEIAQGNGEVPVQLEVDLFS